MPVDRIARAPDWAMAKSSGPLVISPEGTLIVVSPRLPVRKARLLRSKGEDKNGMPAARQ